MPSKEKNTRKTVSLIGTLPSGCTHLSTEAIALIQKANILAGGKKILAFFATSYPDKTLLPIQANPKKTIQEIKELALENDIAILASGDPLFFGIGKLVIECLGIENVHIIPNLSFMQLACAKIGQKWDDASCISLHGRSREGFITKIKDKSKVVCLTDPKNHPAAIASYMLDYNEKNWEAWVCENLANPEPSTAGEKIRHFSELEELARTTDIANLNMLILKRKSPAPSPIFINRHEDEYVKRVPKAGLITKKEIRLFSIAQLSLRGDDPQANVVWDIGAGSGSVAIECAHLSKKVYAIECNDESIVHCKENCKKMQVDNVEVVAGLAPEVLEEIPDDPSAVFIGGSKGNMSNILEYCFKRLVPGGRIVVNTITMENTSEAYAWCKKAKIEPEILLLQISRAVPLAHYLRYEAQNPIHVFCIKKEGVS